jgi:hypothetical protein
MKAIASKAVAFMAIGVANVRFGSEPVVQPRSGQWLLCANSSHSFAAVERSSHKKAAARWPLHTSTNAIDVGVNLKTQNSSLVLPANGFALFVLSQRYDAKFS